MAAKKSSAKKGTAKKSTAKKVSVTKAERIRNSENDARGAAKAAKPVKSNTETTTIGKAEPIEDETVAPPNYDKDGGGVPEGR